jgi:hypothetical protein
VSILDHRTIDFTHLVGRDVKYSNSGYRKWLRHVEILSDVPIVQANAPISEFRIWSQTEVRVSTRWHTQ